MAEPERIEEFEEIFTCEEKLNDLMLIITALALRTGGVLRVPYSEIDGIDNKRIKSVNRLPSKTEFVFMVEMHQDT